jgi:hypothetical protein
MQYAVNDGSLYLDVQAELRDFECSSLLGDVKDVLRTAPRPSQVIVDMSRTEWMDPLPMLALGALLHTVAAYGVRTILHLGSFSENPNRISFLKFLEGQGFIAAFGKFAEFKWNNNDFTPDSCHDLRKLLVDLKGSTHYHDADCIFASFIPIADLRDDPEHIRLDAKVERLVTEANDRLIESAYGRDPWTRDRLLQKTRRILFELLCNVVDHAYPGNLNGEPVKGYAGIYARMRTGLPSNSEEAADWRKLLEKERLPHSCPAIAPFDPNPLAPWIEIFFCDVGEGLFAHLDKWIASEAYPDVAKVIDELRAGRKQDTLKTLGTVH